MAKLVFGWTFCFVTVSLAVEKTNSGAKVSVFIIAPSTAPAPSEAGPLFSDLGSHTVRGVAFKVLRASLCLLLEVAWCSGVNRSAQSIRSQCQIIGLVGTSDTEKTKRLFQSSSSFLSTLSALVFAVTHSPCHHSRCHLSGRNTAGCASV